MNYLDFLPHPCAKNGSPPTCFTHLLADPRITLAEWGSNPVLRPFLKQKWGKEFTFVDKISANGQFLKRVITASLMIIFGADILIARLRAATKSEMDALNARIDALSHEIDVLAEQRKSRL